MRKVIYAMMVSLDGMIAGPNGELDWHVVDEELHRHFNDRERTIDIHLYGRKLYENMASFWPTAEEDPVLPGFMVEYARIWKKKRKIVFSRTLERVDHNAELASGDIAGVVRKLKEEPGNSLVVGGSDLASSFIRLGLVDEYHAYVNPVVAGEGIPMFLLDLPTD